MFALPTTQNNDFLSLDKDNLGLSGEALVATIFRLRGYFVQHTAYNQSECGDLRITDTRTGVSLSIEVKTAKRGKNRRSWQFCMMKKGHTNCRKSDLTVLVAIDDHNRPFLYIIPSCVIFAKNITLPSHPTAYKGKYAAFRQYDQTLDIADMQATMKVWHHA